MNGYLYDEMGNTTRYPSSQWSVPTLREDTWPGDSFANMNGQYDSFYHAGTTSNNFNGVLEGSYDCDTSRSNSVSTWGSTEQPVFNSEPMAPLTAYPSYQDQYNADAWTGQSASQQAAMSHFTETAITMNLTAIQTSNAPKSTKKTTKTKAAAKEASSSSAQEATSAKEKKDTHKRKKPRQAQEKEQHKHVEAKYRSQIKDHFEDLAAVLPDPDNGNFQERREGKRKMTRGKVLDHAIDYMAELEENGEKWARENERLNGLNEMYEQKMKIHEGRM